MTAGRRTRRPGPFRRPQEGRRDCWKPRARSSPRSLTPTTSATPSAPTCRSSRASREQWWLQVSARRGGRRPPCADGHIKFPPRALERSLPDHWLENIQDWCISRQLWWGHRIPVWYRRKASTRRRSPRPISATPRRSTWLARRTPPIRRTGPRRTTCSTRGSVRRGSGRSPRWAGRTPASPKAQTSSTLRSFYPTTDARHRAPDIIFFWVARMIMAGLEFMRPGESIAAHSVQERLFHRHHPRPAGPQDVEVPRQLARPARPHRQIRRRRPALRHRLDRAAGAGHPLPREDRIESGPQFLQQALERVPLSPDERRGGRQLLGRRHRVAPRACEVRRRRPRDPRSPARGDARGEPLLLRV